MGRLTLNVLLSFAQFEREVTSERIRDKIAASKKKGIWMGGCPPLGYDVVSRRLVPNLTEAETLKTIFKAALEVRSLTRLEAIIAARGIRAKSWVTQNGDRVGGGALTRSALARMLRNPVYIGKIHHDGRLYDGEHEAILTKALWDSVQTMLDEGAKERKNGENKSFYAPLRDLVFDDQGNRMVPTYNKKKNRIAYRYYVSLPLIRGASQKTGTINRINAAYLERIVAKALHDDEEHDAEARLEQSFVDRIEKITLYKDEITIDLKARGNDLLQRLHIAAALKKPSHRRQVFMHGGKNNQNEGLIKAVAQAYGWCKALEAGAYPTVKELAVQKNLSERYVWKILRLAYLSPAIVEAVLDGRQPPGLSLHQINKTQLSPDWGSQSQALGFDFAR